MAHSFGEARCLSCVGQLLVINNDDAVVLYRLERSYVKPCAIWRVSAELSWMGAVTICHGPVGILLRFAASSCSVYLFSLQGRVMGGFSMTHAQQMLLTAGSYIVILDGPSRQHPGVLYRVQSHKRVCAVCSIRPSSGQLITFVASSANIWMCVYSDIRQTVWNLRAFALDLVGGKAITQVCWKNTSSSLLNIDGDQKHAFIVYDVADSVFTAVNVSCERQHVFMQVLHSLSLGAFKFLPGIGALIKQIGGRKVVLFSEERVPHCKSLSRMAWLQACGV